MNSSKDKKKKVRLARGQEPTEIKKKKNSPHLNNICFKEGILMET